MTHSFPTRRSSELADIKRLFTPEFRNRLDAIIGFTPLSRDVILRVVDKFLMQLEDQLHEKRVEAVFSQALHDHLAKEGFDPAMGARPMRSEEHTSELQSLMRISYAVFCLNT